MLRLGHMFQRTMYNQKTCITDTNTSEGKKVWNIVLMPKLNVLDPWTGEKCHTLELLYTKIEYS
jgi:hypothetical protein